MMVTESTIGDLIRGKLSSADGLMLLDLLQPEHIDQELFELVLNTVRSTVAEKASELHSFAESIVDCCGTGGSGISTFNTSTLVAFVLASAGLQVTKIGNRAVSGSFGSFDLLNALGIGTNISFDQTKRIMVSSGMAFLFAPSLYPALANIGALRRQFAKRTVFNYIGPLLNPFMPEYRLLGVSNADMQKVIAGVLTKESSNKCSFVVRGFNGLDEVLCHGYTTIFKIRKGNFSAAEFQAEGDASCCTGINLSRFDPVEMFWSIVNAETSDGCSYKLVVNNAAAGLYLTGKVKTMFDGQKLASDLLQGGKVKAKVEEVRRAYAQCS